MSIFYTSAKITSEWCEHQSQRLHGCFGRLWAYITGTALYQNMARAMPTDLVTRQPAPSAPDEDFIDVVAD